MYLRVGPYQEVLQGVLVSLQIDEGIIKIIGKNGAGKSALCRQLHDELRANEQPAILFDEPPASLAALQSGIASRLEFDASGNFTRALGGWLQANDAGRKPLVLIVDDAQKLDPSTFGALRMLCNVQDSAHSFVRIVLCGTDELDARLASPVLRAVTQFISHSFTLPYLTHEQVRDFCHAYALRRGGNVQAPTERALDKFSRETKGRPGLLYARLEQGSSVEPAGLHVPGAVTDQAQPVEQRSGRKPGRWWPLAIGAALLLAGAAAYLYLATRERRVTEVDAEAVAPPWQAGVSLARAVPVAESVTATPVVGEPVKTDAVEAAQAAAPATMPPQADAIESFIRQWIASWQAQDVGAYFAHYHPDFAPMQGTRADWEQQRRNIIEQAGVIAIDAEPPQSITVAQDGMRVARFWLNYRSTGYADRTLKELVLVPVDGAWRIRAERNLRTESL